MPLTDRASLNGVEQQPNGLITIHTISPEGQPDDLNLSRDHARQLIAELTMALMDDDSLAAY